jgi:uncharacterized protein (DUF2249 family)/quercetin dioxygenase-like cupin family protein
MQKLNLNVLVEYDDKRFNPKVLMNEPGYRMVLLSMRAGQSVAEHESKGIVTVHAILGHITIYVGPFPDELYAGEILCIESGRRHSLEAHEDSALLVLSTDEGVTSLDGQKDLDLCQVPRPQRHPLVFERFDTLAVGESFVLKTDHNPVILNREMENMRPGQVDWEHINRGPDIYLIRIRRVALPRTSGSRVPKLPEELIHELHNM